MLRLFMKLSSEPALRRIFQVTVAQPPNDCDDNRPAPDIDPFREQICQIVCARDHGRRHIDTDLSNDPGQSGEECSSASSRSVPGINDGNRVPDVLNEPKTIANIASPWPPSKKNLLGGLNTNQVSPRANMVLPVCQF